MVAQGAAGFKHTMKVSLINTSFKDIYGYERMFPLGLGYIASVLREAGHEVSLIEPQIDSLSDDELLELLSDMQPDIIGITAVTTTFPDAVNIVRTIKKGSLKAKVVLGGVHASCFPEQILRAYPEFDFVVFGEGEYTMLYLCNQLMQEDNDFYKINGLCFRQNSSIVKTRPRDYIVNLDTLPLPARDLVNLSKYSLPLHIEKGKRSASMITSRGCPAKCVFCSSKVTMGGVFRTHSSDYVIKEIEHLLLKYSIRHIQFVDDTFTVSAERVKRICEEVIQRHLKFEWHCFARVETVNEDLLLLMKRAGCSTILFGIESGDEAILKNIKKGISLKKAKEAHDICKKVGIEVLSSFIIGHPGETLDTANKTINFALEIKPTFALFYRLVPYPGSPAYEYYNSRNRLRQDLKWGSFAPKGSEVVFEHENLSAKELDSLIIRAYKKFYLNPSNILRILKLIRNLGQIRALVVGFISIVRQVFRWKK